MAEQQWFETSKIIHNLGENLGIPILVAAGESIVVGAGIYLVCKAKMRIEKMQSNKNNRVGTEIDNRQVRR